jgi:hypothetical protein
MDQLEKAFYETKFENAFLRAKSNAFQDFFNELMGRAYKSDYMPCRPWGKLGDRKNDGFLKSENRLFQVYGPNEMAATTAITKIDEDFNGAKEYWGELFNKWSFVHNAYDGIPPHVQKKILDLEKANPGIKLDPWGFEELRVIFRRLEKQDLETWFGYAPNREAKVKMGFEEIRVVLETISSRKPDKNISAKKVPPKKIEANQLSDSIATLIKEGMTKATLIDDFFSKWHDPTFGENLAGSFREHYENIRGKLTPNEIFNDFQTWIGGSERGTAEHEMAVLTVIAYYFESCDIFEEPKE